MPSVAAWIIIRRCFDFIRLNWQGIFRRTWHLTIAGCGLFYLTFNAYLSELEEFLGAPSDAHASIVLGLVSAAFFLQLFFYTLIVAKVSEFALNRNRPGGCSLHIGYQEGRLYAASLRFILLMIAVIAAGRLVFLIVSALWLGSIAEDAVGAIIVAALVILATRIGFLLPAIAVAAPKGLVIRRSWQLSTGIVWPLLLIALIVIIPGLLLESFGELLVHVLGLVPLGARTDTLQNQINSVRLIFPVFTIFTSLSVTLTLILHAIASVMVYSNLSNGQRGPG